VKAFTIVLTLIFGLCLSGCYSATTLILLPDESGKVGAITVKAQGELRVIDQAYHSVSTKSGTSPLSETQALSEAQVNQEYADLIKAQPAKPTSFILYFVSGSTDLVKESKAIIPQIIDRIKAQMPTEVRVIGHTDTKGSDELNKTLSQKRALAVEEILKTYMPSLDKVEVQSFGSKDQLVPTPPNVNEPRNRRVEILVL
jgi:outer membrane protein OmpA-like peptidoglycan-associated protein